MTVIAMTREMGTLGKDVAAGVAEQLGLEIIHHELVESDVAKRLEIGTSEVHHFLEGNPSLMERWKIDKNKLSRYTAEEILDLAAKGNVIIRGWGAANLLRSIPHILCVRICAPMKFRIREMMDRMGIENEGVAYQEIRRNDAAHTRTIKGFTAGDWQDPLNYDIVLNTERVSIERGIAQVCDLAQDPAFQENEETRTALNDKVIEAKANEAVSQRTYGQHIRVGSVSDGKVTLTGVSPTEELINDAIESVKTVEGVTKVESEIEQTLSVRSYHTD